MVTIPSARHDGKSGKSGRKRRKYEEQPTHRNSEDSTATHIYLSLKVYSSWKAATAKATVNTRRDQIIVNSLPFRVGSGSAPLIANIF